MTLRNKPQEYILQAGQPPKKQACTRISTSTVGLFHHLPPHRVCRKDGKAHALSDMASNGEIRVDQARRGYDVAADNVGQLVWYNPFYMKYAPDEEGNFNGQTGYGYISFEKFVDAVTALKEGKATLESLDQRGLPTLKNTIATTAILEAGKRSLDEGRTITIISGKEGEWSLK